MDPVTKTLKRWLIAFIAVGITVVASSCDSSPTSNATNRPADHTANNGGTLHKPGFRTPLDASSGCTTCHGADLRGGTATIDGVDVMTPSCFSCHGKKWS